MLTRIYTRLFAFVNHHQEKLDVTELQKQIPLCKKNPSKKNKPPEILQSPRISGGLDLSKWCVSYSHSLQDLMTQANLFSENDT